MRVCIHRGTHEIGGTCVEIEAQGKRIVLDVGLPLDADAADAPLPKVAGFAEADPKFADTDPLTPGEERQRDRFLSSVGFGGNFEIGNG
ncbi:MAG: hypothetical protein NT049_14420, partial [Planctomycetota bacterium]|nr:hypothetical protein [Planctomycetota bacterium]